MKHRQWFDQLASKWDTLLTEEIVARLREMIASLEIQSEAKILDLGCGTGVLFPMLLKKVGQDGCLIGLDISSEMLGFAQAKGLAVQCVQGDGEKLPFMDQTFDWVIGSSVFPHFLDKASALRETRRVLKDGGRLLLCHPKSRQTVNAIHQSIGEPIASDTIPDEEEVRRLLAEAQLDRAVVRDEPNRYLVLASRSHSDQPYQSSSACVRHDDCCGRPAGAEQGRTRGAGHQHPGGRAPDQSPTGPKSSSQVNETGG